MPDFNFNPYAFSAPRNKDEYIALLDEAIRMGKELNAMWEEVFSLMRPGAN